MAGLPDAELAAILIEGNKTQSSTKKGYGSKLKYITNYFKSLPNSDELVDGEDELKIPLPFAAVRSLFGRLATDTKLPKQSREERTRAVAAIERLIDENGEDNEDINDAQNSVTISKSCIQGYKSALKSYYETVRKCKFFCPDLPENEVTLDRWCDNYIKAYGNTIANKKQKGVMKVKEGKSEIAFNGYEKLNRAFISYKPPPNNSTSWNAGILCWCCSTLMWNMVCRSEVLDGLHFAHFSWVNDSLRINVVRSKKDQGGTGIGKDKNLKANPVNPALCPVLAVGLYVFSKYIHREFPEDSKFFNGKDQRQRYANIFKKVLEIFPDAELELQFGCPRSEIGTHSHRKGGITFLLGIIDGPNPCAVYIRAGWSLGNTQDRYIMGGSGEDELCGRILCGLRMDQAEEFAILPPHFSTRGMEMLQERRLDRFLVGYENYETGFKHCVPYFLASILYHLPTLREWFPMEHPVWASPLFANNTAEDLDSLRLEVKVGYHACDDTDLRATGVPSMLCMQNQILCLERSLTEMKNSMQENLERGIESLQKEVREEVPQTLERMLLERFNITGVNPFTMQDVQILLNNSQAQVVQELKTMMDQIRDGGQQAPRPAAIREARNELYQWGGAFHMVPEGFNFPKCSCKCIWSRWWLGQSEPSHIIPFKNLYFHYKKTDLKKQCRSNVDKVFAVVKEILTFHNYDREDYRNRDYREAGSVIGVNNCDTVFDECYPKLIRRLYGDAKYTKPSFRWNDLTYTTIYNQLCAEKKRRRAEMEGEDEGDD